VTLYPIEYYQFFIHFNEGDYYTCHDLLELIWLTEKDNLFLKGLLQMTVAIYHYEYGNIKGARLMMQAGHSYIQSYRPFHWGVDLEKVNAFIEECLVIIPSGIQSVSFEKAGQLPKLPALFLYLEEEHGKPNY
jgi:predicted metal-dependent hydrolase